MIVKKNVLIASVSNPSAITALIPHAKHIRFKGKELVLVPHRLDETQVLKNLGLNPPSPITTQYDWTGRFTPMSHQLETASFFTLNKRCFCLNEMGTGKTSAALWAADWLMKIGAIDEVLVICPISVMKEVWLKEAFATTPHRTCELMTGNRDKRLRVLNSTADIKIINFDGLVSIKDEVAAYSKTRRVLVIVDEASTYRTYGNKRYKALVAIITPFTWLWLMTGTPTPNAPTDAWALAKLVNKDRVPASFKLFQETVMKQVGPYKWVPRLGAEQIAFQALQPAVRFLKKDCLDLPEVTYNDRSCAISPAQQQAYDNFKKRMRHEDKDNGVDITAANAAVRILKLQQVFCGVVKDDDGNGVYLDNAPRLALTEELVQEAGGKVIIFAPFKFSMRQIKLHLEKHGYRVGLVNGDTAKNERDRIFNEFQNGTEIDILVAHPATTAHGLTLTASSTIIWYAPIYSSELYEQANARIDRKGQTMPCTVYHIGCHPLEWYIYEVLQKKISMQGSLLSLYNQLLTGAGSVL